MIARRVVAEVLQGLDQRPAVALIGPRQVGKTTLALEVGKSRNAVYLDLERELDRLKLQDLRTFLSANPTGLVIFDEVHRMPALFPELRGIIDAERRAGLKSGRFLLLGSASLDLLQQAGESLAGRIRYVNIGPFQCLEVTEQDRLWLRGGFPESYLADDEEASYQWRMDFIRSYYEREINSFGLKLPVETMRRLWTMLAHRQGSPLNASELARAIEVSAQSMTRYIDIMCDLLLIRRLPPYSVNVGKRLVKSPKIYWRDSGIVHERLQIRDIGTLLAHPVCGLSWEGHVIESVLANAGTSVNAFFYRTAAGAEVDLVLEWPDQTLWAIEIKRGTPTPGRGFSEATDDLKPSQKFVVHSGPDRFPLRNGIEAISLTGLCEHVVMARQDQV